MTNNIRLYDPTASRLEDATVVVICVRDPDADNSYDAWGREFGNGIGYVHDVDCGRSDLKDADEYREWAEGHNEEAERLDKAGWPEAASALRDIVEQYRPEYEDDH